MKLDQMNYAHFLKELTLDFFRNYEAVKKDPAALRKSLEWPLSDLTPKENLMLFSLLDSTARQLEAIAQSALRENN